MSELGNTKETHPNSFYGLRFQEYAQVQNLHSRPTIMTRFWNPSSCRDICNCVSSCEKYERSQKST